MSEQQINIGPDGKIRLIDHSELGEALGTVARQRASHVEPANRILRGIFRALRAHTNDSGPVAAFTRSWPCLWTVAIIDGPSFGPYRQRPAMSKHNSHRAINEIADSLQALIECEEPTPLRPMGEQPMAQILGDIGRDVFTYAKGLESSKAQIFANVLSGIACCIAGMPLGVPQTDCQQFSTELMEALRTTIADHDYENPLGPQSPGDPEEN